MCNLRENELVLCLEGRKKLPQDYRIKLEKRDLLLKKQREWMKESEYGKCRCGWGKNI